MSQACLTITTIGDKGDGIATFEDKKVFVSNVLPHEVVEVELSPNYNNTLRGEVTKIVTSSPNRKDPACSHYSVCGGCSLQHMNIETYQTWKFDKVKSQLSAKGIIPTTWNEPIFIGQNTRRRATFSLSKNGKKLKIGYNQKRSKNVFDLQECLLLDPDIIKAKEYLAVALCPIIPEKEKIGLFIQKISNGLDVVITGNLTHKNDLDLEALEIIADIVQQTNIIRFSWQIKNRETPQVIIEQACPYIQFGSLNVPVPPLAFLQPSMQGQNALTNVIKSYLPKFIANAVDLFCGCGTFTSILLDQTKNVDAYENDQHAINALKKSGHQQSFIRNLFKDPLMPSELNKYDIAIIDPPRAGARSQIYELAKSDVSTIISVSCNPSSFANDAQTLVDHGYKLQNLTMIDQFLWSDHVELVGLFIK